ncbi:hypothetical protein BHC44_02655 [Snodgrassella alvi]|uniref:Uncharacterized protein n=1 Tax=Snodgrassella alvi TaxID=1196083 RepID=A0A2N9XXD0_9NEIS|nr:hypothetical protein [Snodgrassella alvi]PIT54537.1 hypothetical protein BHC49_08315 [Snodgrassella alvi]PIT55087.1 hypothetical protein BHC44_02655 [Snodgrassella alvi]
MEKDKSVVEAEMSAQPDLDSNVRNVSKQGSFLECSARAGRRADTEALMQLGELKDGFERVKQMPRQLRQRVMDSEYWCTVCFQTHEQLMAFFNALAIVPCENKYIDGQLLAQKLGIELPPAEVRFRLSNYVDKDFQKLVDN